MPPRLIPAIKTCKATDFSPGFQMAELKKEILQIPGLTGFVWIEYCCVASTRSVVTIAGRHPAKIGIIGHLEESTGGEVGWVLDDLAVQVVDLFCAVRIAQKVPCNRPQCVVIPDLVQRLIRCGFTTYPSRWGYFTSFFSRKIDGLGVFNASRPVVGLEVAHGQLELGSRPDGATR